LLFISFLHPLYSENLVRAQLLQAISAIGAGVVRIDQAACTREFQPFMFPEGMAVTTEFIHADKDATYDCRHLTELLKR